MEINETKITNLEVAEEYHDCRQRCGLIEYDWPVCDHKHFSLRVSDDYGRTWGLTTLNFKDEYAEEENEAITLKQEKKVQAHLDNGGKLNPDCWTEGHPIYGSDAWIAFEREELAPISQALASGHLHERDIPDSLQAYY